MFSTFRKWIGRLVSISNKTYIETGALVCFLVLAARLSSGQACTDFSGELLVNQTFGTASRPVSLAGLTTYLYDPANCPVDGHYTLTPSLDGTCFDATWYAIATNHTPNDVQGNMLVINGGPDPGTFYQQAVSDVCPGSSYEVSVWIVNVLRTGTCLNAIIPNVSVTIETSDGQVIQSTPLGLITQTDTPLWRRYTMVFTTPVTEENVVIKLVNNQGGSGCGNDMAIDDFQVRQCSECVGLSGSVYIPDAFTPNQDGINDTLAAFFRRSVIRSFRLKIYNRWGSLVFSTTSPDHSWDGTYAGNPCPADTYTWVVTYQPSTVTETEHTQTGRVVLLR